MHYIVNDKNEALLWSSLESYNNGDAPLLSQPSWPDFTPWKDGDEATAWIENLIKYESKESNLIPKNSPFEEQRYRTQDSNTIVLPSGDEITEEQLAALQDSGWQIGDEIPEGIIADQN